MSITLPITYRSQYQRAGNEIEWNGQVFNCTQAGCGGGICSVVSNQCVKCNCLTNSVHCTILAGSGQCNNQSNAPIWNAWQTQVLTCAQAGAVISSPTNQVDASSVNSYNQLCQVPNGVLACCQGSVNAGVCSNYWGPTDYAGNCDATMSAFCSQNPKDPTCACISSMFPVAQCQDTRCSNTSAYRSSGMKNSSCTGAYLTCIQYDTIISSGEASYINSTYLAQNCTQNNGSSGPPPASSSSGSSSSPATSSQNKIKLIIIVVSVFVGVILLGSAIRALRKPKPVRMYPKPYMMPPNHANVVRPAPQNLQRVKYTQPYIMRPIQPYMAHPNQANMVRPAPQPHPLAQLH